MTPRKPAAGKVADTASWDAFWAEVSGSAGTETIRGVVVPVPTDLPMLFQVRLDELRESERDEDMHELIGLLFGEGVLQRWIDAGMGLLEFQVVLAWGIAAGRGTPVTFSEAHQLVVKADAAGKAGSVPPNRAARRAAPKKPSAATGGRSKPTSGASTTSRRKTSPA